MDEVSATTETKSTPEEIVIKWWDELADRRGERAELRRARSLDAVIFTAGYQRLRQRLVTSGWINAESVALVAGVLAHAKKHDPSAKFAAQLARPVNGNRPRYSGLRFRRLLQCTSQDGLFEPAIRALAQLDGKANLVDLARGLYDWSDKGGRGDRTRRQWVFDYYDANPKAD